MATADALASERADTPRWRWIISGPDDLFWLIGSVASSYLILGLFRLGVSITVLLLVWAFVFDGTHIFGTWSRTYFDTEERRLRPLLLWGSLALFGLGPAIVLAGYGSLFFYFAVGWAYHHLVQQQYGFMVLYKKKNHDLAHVDNAIDRAFLLLGLWYPFLDFMLRTTAVQQPAPFNVESQGVWLFREMLRWGFLASAAMFATRQLQKFLRGEPLDAPKHLLLAAALPMHWTVFTLLEPGPLGLTVSVPATTIFHNIQYHRLIWFHNQNTYGADSGAQRHGWATVISSHFWIYAAVGLAFTAAYKLPRYLLFPSEGWVASVFWGYTFIHYFLDSKIWSVRHDQRLGASLRLAES